jgi:hypothetical protein
MRSAQDIIKQLNLAPHPEKGYFIQTFVDPEQVDGRSRSTVSRKEFKGRNIDIIAKILKNELIKGNNKVYRRFITF